VHVFIASDQGVGKICNINPIEAFFNSPGRKNGVCSNSYPVILFHKCIHYRSRKGVRPCRFLKIGKVFIIEFIKHRAKDIDIDIELWKKICPKDIFVGSSSIPITDHLVSSLPDLIDQFFRLD
jgi:hypothetical protein